MHIVRASLLILSAIIGTVFFFTAWPSVHAQQPETQQKLVESVDIIGNRRLRKEDILYYVQTRPGDVYNPQQVQRDLQAILAYGFFDKTATRVTAEDAPRGGIAITFYVEELPIIRDIQFEGLKSVPESDVLKAFRERRIGVSKEAVYDPVKVNNAQRVIKELLAAKGHPNATIEHRDEEVSKTSTAITFVVNEGERVRVADIQFEGNQVFSDGSLRSQMKLVKEAGLISRFRGQDILDREKLDYDLRRVQNYMRSKGYLQARYGEPTIEGLGRRQTGFFIPLPFISSTDETLRVTVPITEGKLYRIGDLKIEGNSIFNEQYIRAVIGLQKGDVANGEKISKALFENLKKIYGSQGFIQYTAEPTPTFKDNPANPKEGTVDFTITIDEGKQFTLRRLEFLGNTFTRDNVLRREVVINEGDIYSQTAFEFSVLRLNQLGFFDPVDKDKDVDFRTNEEEGLVDVNVKVSERGRQQISFNGGLSGIGGSFFGLEYSTNNLLGRGEILSFQLAAGNRQRSFQFSFTEPYIRNRPITAGFSVFSSSLKFFGEGTFISQNTNALQGVLGNTTDFFNTNEENLFTRTSNGISVFASAPLSEFYRKRRFTQASRIGLSYQIARSSVKQPAVNSQNNATTFIPVIYDQPNILTSRVTGTFSYNTKNYAKDANDPVSGKEISTSIALTGLGGDVRTYAPTLSYTQFIPVRKKRSDNPEVFGFRILIGSVGSFATSNKIRNSNSLAFVNGVPIYERFFLGDEFTIRGYNVRSISPIVPLDSFATTRNVVLASNQSGTPVPLTGLQGTIPTFTGPAGANPLQISARTFTFVGGDTQMLGNFEYRIPIFGPVTLAAFADVGTAFNLRKGGDQTFSSNFLTDEQFLATTGLTLNSLAILNNPRLAQTAFFDANGAAQNSLVIRDNRLVTAEELTQALNAPTPFDPITGLPFGFQRAFLRGEAQTNTVARLNESLFSKFTDYRSSLGAEVRFQVPVINVPFRLIYAYNPNARTGVVSGLPFNFNEKKSVFRFSIGRTF
ncbi:MAG: outer membrane protein insertion porin family [Blastocatellia bacterium]|jgi:outer membrane protein insertion porin family|nr:outer membrane protein insertion porin family [Blastocatellia bacterium]